MVLSGTKMTMFSSIFHAKTAPVADYESAASVIEAFADGKSGLWDWDEFTSIKKKDAFLESVRRRCLSVREEHPARTEGAYCNTDGLETLRTLAQELRTKAAQARG
jgi:hypothetical protein